MCFNHSTMISCIQQEQKYKQIYIHKYIQCLRAAYRFSYNQYALRYSSRQPRKNNQRHENKHHDLCIRQVKYENRRRHEQDDGSRNKKKTMTTIPAAVTSAVKVVATEELTEIES